MAKKQRKIKEREAMKIVTVEFTVPQHARLKRMQKAGGHKYLTELFRAKVFA